MAFPESLRLRGCPCASRPASHLMMSETASATLSHPPAPRLQLPMRAFVSFAIVILMSTVVSETVAAQTLAALVAVTDPKQIASRPNAQVEPCSLTIEKLYMTRQVGRPTWAPDGKSIAFISNMSGRNNLWLVPAEGGWPVQLTVG